MLVLVVVPLGSCMVGYIKTESVESNFVYLLKVVERPKSE